MDTKVKVTAQDGNVIVRSANNPEYGHIRVEQTRMLIDDNGFVRRRKLSALIPGTIEDLKLFGWEEGEEIEGRILVKESVTPFNKKDPDRDLKVAGDSGIPCCQYGQPIYRKHVFSLNSNAEDTTVEHTNGEEISAAYAESKEISVESQEDFNL